jgi:hypothetical protein
MTAEVCSSRRSTPRPMDAPSTMLTVDEEDFEICTDHDFIYKHRRDLYLNATPTPWALTLRTHDGVGVVG